MMQPNKIETSDAFWGDRLVSLMSNGDVEGALLFLDKNEATHETWQHGFLEKLFSTNSPNATKDIILKIAEICPVDDVVFDLVEAESEIDDSIFFNIILSAYLILLKRSRNEKHLGWYMSMIEIRLHAVASITDINSRKLRITTSFEFMESAAKLFHPFSLKTRCLLIAETLQFSSEGQQPEIKSSALNFLNFVLPDPIPMFHYVAAILRNEPVTKYNPLLDRAIVAEKTLCLYFGSRILSGQFPIVYSPEYLFVITLPVVHKLLVHTSDELVNLGLDIIMKWAKNFVTCFSVKDLTYDFKQCIRALNNVMIYSQEKPRRDVAVQVFNFLMDSLDDKGLYYLLYNYRKLVQHPSTLSYLMFKMKKSFMDPSSQYFKGRRLFNILSLYADIDEKINLVDEHLRIVTTLNFLWYLVGCHKRNNPPIEDFFFEFIEHFVEIVEDLIRKARLENKESENQVEQGKNCNLSVTMYKEFLPDLTQEEKLSSIASVRNAIDIVENNLKSFITFWKN